MADHKTTDQPAPASILDSYVMKPPSQQNALDIFAGEWACKFPPPFDHFVMGGNPAFQDGRLLWALNQFNGVQDQNILELGPLEGGHSYILERAGAACITSIEANTRAYLKCLIVKEVLNLSRTRYLCGDFITYLENSRQQYDTIVASGVLYHMKNPVKLLELIGRHTQRAYIWTHYFDAAIIAAKPYLQPRFQKTTQVKIGSKVIVEHRHDYQESLSTKGFCGGNEEYSNWLAREDILEVLRECGFTHFEFGYETPDHPHGPAFSMIAIKK